MTPAIPSVLLANGLNGATGEYLLAPQTPAEVAEAALAQTCDADHLREMQHPRFRRPHRRRHPYLVPVRRLLVHGRDGLLRGARQ